MPYYKTMHWTWIELCLFLVLSFASGDNVESGSDSTKPFQRKMQAHTPGNFDMYARHFNQDRGHLEGLRLRSRRASNIEISQTVVFLLSQLHSREL
jgi:hypothetical protein